MRGTGAAGATSDEHGLAEHARRWAARPAGRVAIVLHFSRLPPPGPRPHHRRIAEAVMEDVAHGQDGHLHRLRNGDLALLCAIAAARGAPATAAALPGVLGRLLGADVADPSTVISVWPLGTEAASLLTYARARLDALAEDAPTLLTAAPATTQAPSPQKPAPPLAVETGRAQEVADALRLVDAAQIVRRQLAVAIEPGQRLRPLYREPTLSLAATDQGSAGSFWSGSGGGDPFLMCHLAGQLDGKMLTLVSDALGRGGPLDPAASGGCPLHLNLMLSTVCSAGFARFAAACGRAGATLGVEVSLLDACADPTGFEAARAILSDHGMILVLDGVSHAALLMLGVATLRPDLLKLDWSPALADLAAPQTAALDTALREVGLARVVLHRAESEAALRWGVSRGIRRFQGRHVDAMLAATRLAACAHAAGCTLRQCVARGGAATARGRAGCADPTRLDPRTSGGVSAPALAA